MIAEKQSKQSGRGGRRQGAGRPKGKVSAKTLEIQGMAKEHAPAALAALVAVATSGESESARVSAASALLDRGYGKPAQIIAGDKDRPLEVVLRRE